MEEVFQDLVIEGLVSHQPFEPAVLFFKRLQPGRFATVRATVRLLRPIQALLADAVLAAEGCHRRTRFVLLQHSDNLLLREPASTHAVLLVTNSHQGLTPEQARAFLKATADHPAHALYALAITTGMRAGELLGLLWDDIDLDAGRLTVQRALQQQNEAGLVFVTPKNARSRRMILLSQLAVDALRAHRDRQTFQRHTPATLAQMQGLTRKSARTC